MNKKPINHEFLRNWIQRQSFLSNDIVDAIRTGVKLPTHPYADRHLQVLIRNSVVVKRKKEFLLHDNWRLQDNTPFDDSDFDNWQGGGNDFVGEIDDLMNKQEQKPAIIDTDLTWLLSDEDIAFNKDDQQKPDLSWFSTDDSNMFKNDKEQQKPTVDDIENCPICGKRYDIQGNCPYDCVLELFDPYVARQADNELKFCQEYVQRFTDHKDELNRWHDEGLRLAYPTESGWYWHRSGIWVTDLPLPEGSVSILKKGGARQKGNTLFITVDDISYPIGNVESD